VTIRSIELAKDNCMPVRSVIVTESKDRSKQLYQTNLNTI